MPRSGRGGSRVGTPGKPYANRSDLRGAKLPVQTATGQQYGVAGQQAQAQRLIPMRAAPAPAAPAGGAGDLGVSTPSASAPPAGPEPGGLGDLLAKTQRPGEPVTAGAAFGPGPGMEALAQPRFDPIAAGAAILNQLGDKADPETARLRSFLNGLIGNQAAL